MAGILPSPYTLSTVSHSDLVHFSYIIAYGGCPFCYPCCFIKPDTQALTSVPDKHDKPKHFDRHILNPPSNKTLIYAARNTNSQPDMFRPAKIDIGNVNLGIQEQVFHEIPYSSVALEEIDRNLLTSVLLLSYDEHGTLYTLVHRQESDRGKLLISSPGGFVQSGRQWGLAASMMVTRKTGIDVRKYRFHVLLNTSNIDIPGSRKCVIFYIYLPFPVKIQTKKQACLDSLDPTFTDDISRNKWVSVYELLTNKTDNLNCYFEVNLCLLANEFRVGDNPPTNSKN